MIRISTNASKDRAFDIITSILDNFIFTFVKDEDKKKLINHMARLRAHNGSLDVSCRLETFPEVKLTRIVIDAYSVE